ncbi:2,3-bisphosphoglycerate-independent phosphoglycerate mutase [Candidatus Bathyarchaeota archaeon]|nr:2,3-bisphosphoglycerate-independent phosphoglycerate mutase [Candidatus Bathyarchaeota archaeon]
MKAVLIVGDGMADRAISRLGGRTPLEVAKKPALDKLATLGINGIIDIIAPGIPPGSDTAHLSIFGYDPFEVYQGRGVFEALGVGLEVKPGDIAFRCNFATVDENLNVIDRRAGRIESGSADELAKSLRNLKLDEYPEVEIIFKHSTEHRGALILRGPGLSRMVSDSDPEEANAQVQVVKPLDNSQEAAKTATILNKLTHLSNKVLEEHSVNIQRRSKGLLPANILLFRGASGLPQLDLITTRYGIRAACIAVTAIIRGVCISAGFRPIDVAGTTGTVETDTLAKGRAAVEALKEYDLIFLHVKGADNASHDGNLKQKIRMIEKIDSMVGYILDKIDLRETYIALLADHTTPLSVKNHTGDPVPIAIAGPEVIRDDVKCFSERDCAKGGLGRISGKDIMPILMNFLGKQKKFGA